MRRRIEGMATRVLAALLMTGLAFAGMANAKLIDRGEGLLYDTVLNITWAQSAGLQGGQQVNWFDAHDWAVDLIYGGFDDWRLPYANINVGGGHTMTVYVCSGLPPNEPVCRWNEMGYMWQYNLGGAATGVDKSGDHTTADGVQVLGIQNDLYWSDTQWTGDLTAWYFDFRNNTNSGQDKYDAKNAAWAVRDGDVCGQRPELCVAVPEPAGLALIVLGLGVLAVGRRRTT